jgi:hypothetical protein
MESKTIWLSKTFWVNLLALAGMIAQGITGSEVFPLEVQASILTIINIGLRFITKQAVTW